MLMASDGDCALGRPYESLRSTASLGTSDGLRDPTSSQRNSPHMKATDYVGQASRRQSSTISNPEALLSIESICAPALNSSHVHQIPNTVGRVLWIHSLFLLAHCQKFRFLSSLFLANMVWLYFPPDHCRRGRLDWFCDNVHSSSVPDYADTTRS